MELAQAAPAVGHEGEPAGGDSYGTLPFGMHRLTGVLNALGTLWIFVLMLVINVDVFGRNLLGKPLDGVPEILSLSIVAIVFLQLPDTLRIGGFTRADLLLDAVKKHSVRVYDWFHIAFHGVGAAMMIVTMWACWTPLLVSIRNREYVGTVGGFQAPVWPVDFITLVGLGLTGVCYLLLFWKDVRRLAGRRA